eukprot:CAMPEP_0168444050 /NCGR_PEP_ID=MMETSP0228-20121227/44845_1 /TAXON_ID=133427 /ORGANISM="Protoceratium reticulatum, Strain CCCM 535 (=CCMP 1889)" /LENGTH=118 /DNA_ID=CAMNT_0008458473 /DNA_START=171 /DNA_END=524 /DNA_ORIENTATION=+
MDAFGGATSGSHPWPVRLPEPRRRKKKARRARKKRPDAALAPIQSPASSTHQKQNACTATIQTVGVSDVSWTPSFGRPPACAQGCGHTTISAVRAARKGLLRLASISAICAAPLAIRL